MTYQWKQLADGRIEVDGQIPELDAVNAAALEKNVLRWLPSSQKWADTYKVPVTWILGVIWAESSGNPKAHSADGGFGLMQLTHPSVFEGHPKQSTIDNPDLNIQLGTKLMRSLITSVGLDLPRVASGYNAGLAGPGKPHLSAASPWGMRETKGHISRVVMGTNTATRLLASGAGPPKAEGPSVDPLKGLMTALALIRLAKRLW
jgi:soluble lytic murein transglycosylase-like protein